MGVLIQFTNTTKRKNSTYRPTHWEDNIECVIKDNCSWDNPVFILKGHGQFAYNYCKWGREYYFIDDVVYLSNNHLEVSCSVDVLATYKESILATNAFVAYDTTPNAEITDKRLSLKTGVTRAENVGNAFDIIGRGLTVIINTVGENSCAAYAMTVEQAATLLESLRTWTETTIPEIDIETLAEVPEAIGEIGNAIIAGFRQLIGSGSAADCIKSAYIMPIDVSRISGTSETVKLGLFDTGKSAKRITGRGVQDASYVAIPWQATDWRRNAPYHDVTLYIPFVGNISLSPATIMDASGLYIDAAFDQTAGDCIFTVTTAPISAGAATRVIGQYGTNIAANFAIGSANVTATQIMTSVAAAAGVVAASFVAPPAGIAAGVAGITGEFNAVQPTPTTVGSAGGGAILALFGYTPRCLTVYHDTTVAPDSVAAVMGTPSMAAKRLGDLTGFVQCIGASVEANAHGNELDTINTFLNSGFFIE